MTLNFDQRTLNSDDVILKPEDLDLSEKAVFADVILTHVNFGQILLSFLIEVTLNYNLLQRKMTSVEHVTFLPVAMDVALTLVSKLNENNT